MQIDRSTLTPRRRLAVLAVPLVAVVSLAAACVPPTPPPAGPTVLSQGGVDAPGIAFEDGEWDLHVHDEDNDVEYEPDEVILKVKDEAATTVPADPAFGFLGASGDPIWVLPQVQNADLLYLGYATEEIESGVFEGDEVTWSLVSVDGPGSFHLYSTDGFGVPTVLFDSDDALPQSLVVPTGAHIHQNWGFTAPGDYTVTYEVTGTPIGDVPVSSGPVEYSFTVGG